MNHIISKFPAPYTLPGRALSLLLQGEQISQQDFFDRTLSFSLNRSISKLRNDWGWPVLDQWRSSETTDLIGRHKRYKLYQLPTSFIKVVGKEGQSFIKAVKDYEAKEAIHEEIESLAKMKNIRIDFIKKNVDPRLFYERELPTAKPFKKDGWNDGGLCPFHDDARPGSFRVNTRTGAYRCFACDAAGGDIIAFNQARFPDQLPLILKFLEAEAKGEY